MPQRSAPLAGLLLALALGAFASATPADAALRMFVTSGTHNGDFNGPGGADAFCQSAADNATPQLVGTFKAWISTAADDAYCRVSGFSGKYGANCGQAQLPNPGPWQRVDGLPFARSLQAMTTFSQVLTPGHVDENGDLVAPDATFAFTGTNFAGVFPGVGNDCGGWDDATVSFVTYGSPHSGPAYWTNFGQDDVCSQAHRLYCFEVGPSTPLPVYEYDGALAFITSTPHDGNYGGLAGADTVCQNLATTEGLPNASSFVAWLSTQSEDAIDRLTWDGPYKRVDGVPIAADKADLVDAATPQGSALVAGIWKTEADVSNFFFAFTGTKIDGTADAETCNNWLSNLGTDHAEFGLGTSSLGTWTQDSAGASVLPCSSTSYYLYCFSNVPILFWDNFENPPFLQRWTVSPPLP